MRERLLIVIASDSEAIQTEAEDTTIEAPHRASSNKVGVQIPPFGVHRLDQRQLRLA